MNQDHYYQTKSELLAGIESLFKVDGKRIFLCPSERFAESLKEIFPGIRAETEIRGVLAVLEDGNKLVSKLERELLFRQTIKALDEELLREVFPKSPLGAERSLAELYEELGLLQLSPASILESVSRTHAVETEKWQAIDEIFALYEELLEENSLVDFSQLVNAPIGRVSVVTTCLYRQTRWTRAVLSRVKSLSNLVLGEREMHTEFGELRGSYSSEHKLDYLENLRDCLTLMPPGTTLFCSDELEGEYLSRLIQRDQAENIQSVYSISFAGFIEACMLALRTRRVQDLLSLARFSEVERYLQTLVADPLAVLDRYQSERIQLRYDSPELIEGEGRKLILALVERYLTPLLGSSLQIFAVLSEWASSWPGAETTLGLLEEFKALRIPIEEPFVILSLLSKELKRSGRQKAYRFGDLPEIIVEHGFFALSSSPLLPESGSGFLPEGVRASLGLRSLKEQSERESQYLLWTIGKTFSSAQIVFAKTDLRGEHRLPNGALLPKSAQSLAVELERFFAGSLRGSPAAVARKKFITLPEKLSAPRKESYSVSELDAYRRSPYLYYLERVLKLTECTDNVHEMDGRQFGSLAHSALEVLMESDPRGAFTRLEEALRCGYQRQFGSNVSPTLVAQKDHLENRFRSLARLQEELELEGWRVLEVEKSLSAKEIVVGKESLRIHGRADRVDRNGERIRIFDYKLRDSSKSDAIIAKNGEILNLQLPLYAWLYGVKDVEVGYIVLKPDGAKVDTIRVTDEIVEKALTEASLALQGILNNEFLPSDDDSPFGSVALLYPESLEGDLDSEDVE